MVRTTLKYVAQSALLAIYAVVFGAAFVVIGIALGA